MKKKVIIIGGGPAGLLAAATSAKAGAEVLLLEKKPRIGLKLRITGKGRCNITNTLDIPEFIKQIHPNGRFLRQSFSQFFREDILEILNNYGVTTENERGGRIFPTSNNAEDVVNALKRYATDNNVSIRSNSKVSSLIVEENKIAGIILENGKDIRSNSVIIATGGNSYKTTGSSGDGYELAKSVGHNISPIFPALIPLITDGGIAKDLQGLSLKNISISFWIGGKKSIEQFGEMIFTHFGVSGPVILKTSRGVVVALRENKSVVLKIDLKPALDHQKLDRRLIREFEENSKVQFKNILKNLLPNKMIDVFLKILKINVLKPCCEISSKERKSLRMLLKEFPLIVLSHRPMNEAIVTAGGIVTNEIYPKTMESKLVSGLYFAGEVIDIDADTGGYNLQAAFSAGYVAGENAALNN
jgi:predicted Rossmann fold flavoprotein